MELNLSNSNWEVTDAFEGDNAAFARLYLVRSIDVDEAVAKCVPIEPGAKRELLVGDVVRSAKFEHVVPVLDSGEHDEYFVIVMPRASESLKKYIERHPDGVSADEAIRIIADVCRALVEIDGVIIHRDVKPANILHYGESWKLGDFGISRFSVEATATITRRHHFTEAYAAPEQWNHEKLTAQTDVYALGVVAYELLEGRLPFVGIDVRSQHLKESPPPMQVGSAKLRQLVTQCLLKVPRDRPQPQEILERLTSAFADTDKPGSAKLAALSASRTRRLLEQQANLAVERDAKAKLATEVESAGALLKPVWQSMRQELRAGAPEIVFDTVIGNAAPLFRARYGNVTLEFDRVDPVEHWDGPFSVVAYSSVTIEARDPGGSRYGRSHSLWYGDPVESDRFSWFELAFSADELGRRASTSTTYSSPPWSSGAALHARRFETLAWPLASVDVSRPHDFVQRWIGWFADTVDERQSENDRDSAEDGT